MTQALDELISILDLEQIEVNIFRGHSPDDKRNRVFGGQVAAQALTAAGRTVSIGNVHSLHSYFLRPGDVNIPILFEVDRIRDGKSFMTRRVVAIQNGEPIFNLSASFHKDEPGVSHQVSMPDVPDPLTLPTLRERVAPWAAQLGDWNLRLRPLDQRYIDPPNMEMYDEPREPRQRVWLKADGKLPNDPLLHACVVTYASDMTLLESAMMPHKFSWIDGNLMIASIDHVMWFHRPIKADQWFLYDQDSPTAAGARAFARGQIFSYDGTLAVSVAQEGLLRVITK